MFFLFICFLSCIFSLPFFLSSPFCSILLNISFPSLFLFSYFIFPYIYSFPFFSNHFFIPLLHQAQCLLNKHQWINEMKKSSAVSYPLFKKKSTIRFISTWWRQRTTNTNPSSSSSSFSSALLSQVAVRVISYWFCLEWMIN